MGLSYSKLAACVAGVPQLAPTTAAEVPGPGCAEPGTPSYGMRHCTSPGCLFGPPLSIPNAASSATSTCVINTIDGQPGAGTGSLVCATGATTLSLPLSSGIYLTGPILGTQACPTCTGGSPGVCGSGTCNGGTRNGLACTPETSPLNPSYPTSHDCPPPNGTFIGSLTIPFDLSTGTQTRTAFTSATQARVFCGFCFDPTFTSAFENPPHPCTSDAECTNGAFTACQQHSPGAFRNPFATTITETGVEAGACLLDGLPHAATLAGIFCVPPSYNGIVDPSAELPGPGAVSLPGTAQLFVPTTIPGATTTSTTVPTTTTTTLLPCGGVFPACLGSCPVGTCTAGGIGQLCTCS
jgi:hypothetical protein